MLSHTYGIFHIGENTGVVMTNIQGYFVTERTGMSSRKFFLRMVQAGSAFRNLFSWHRYN
jgi:hypothetical protein